MCLSKKPRPKGRGFFCGSSLFQADQAIAERWLGRFKGVFEFDS